MKAVWGLDYDHRTDKCFRRPICPKCNEPIYKNNRGLYECVSCREIVDPDEIMVEWLDQRAVKKIEMQDCFVKSCGGKRTVETVLMRNEATLEWQIMSGWCSKCGARFIV